MAEVKSTLSVIALNMYGLNTPNKRQRLEEQIKKYNADSMKQLYVDSKRHILDLKTQFKVEGWDQIYHANSNEKRIGMVVKTRNR